MVLLLEATHDSEASFGGSFILDVPLVLSEGGKAEMRSVGSSLRSGDHSQTIKANETLVRMMRLFWVRSRPAVVILLPGKVAEASMIMRGPVVVRM